MVGLPTPEEIRQSVQGNLSEIFARLTTEQQKSRLTSVSLNVRDMVITVVDDPSEEVRLDVKNSFKSQRNGAPSRFMDPRPLQDTTDLTLTQILTEHDRENVSVLAHASINSLLGLVGGFGNGDLNSLRVIVREAYPQDQVDEIVRNFPILQEYFKELHTPIGPSQPNWIESSRQQGAMLRRWIETAQDVTAKLDQEVRPKVGELEFIELVTGLINPTRFSQEVRDQLIKVLGAHIKAGIMDRKLDQ